MILVVFKLSNRQQLVHGIDFGFSHLKTQAQSKNSIGLKHHNPVMYPARNDMLWWLYTSGPISKASPWYMQHSPSDNLIYMLDCLIVIPYINMPVCIESNTYYFPCSSSRFFPENMERKLGLFPCKRLLCEHIPCLMMPLSFYMANIWLWFFQVLVFKFYVPCWRTCVPKSVLHSHFGRHVSSFGLRGLVSFCSPQVF